MDSIDLEALRVKPERLSVPMPGKTERVPRRFIKGPIPLPWISAAAALKGKALQAALAIWYARGLKKTTGEVRLVPSLVKPFIAGRHSLYRALRQLEGAGLIGLKARRGCSPTVWVIEREEGVDQ